MRMRDKGYSPRASTPPNGDSASGDSRDLETHPQDIVRGQLVATGVGCRGGSGGTSGKGVLWSVLKVRLTLIRK